MKRDRKICEKRCSRLMKHFDFQTCDMMCAEMDKAFTCMNYGMCTDCPASDGVARECPWRLEHLMSEKNR